MKLFGRKQYVLGVIIIVLVLALSVLEARSENAMPVAIKQYGPLTYIIAVKIHCDNAAREAIARRFPRLAAEYGCKLKYHHLIGKTGSRPALVAITERMPTETMMNVMFHKYLRVITQGKH